MGLAEGREEHFRERRACVGQTPSGRLCEISRCKMDTPRLNREGTVSYQAEDLHGIWTKAGNILYCEYHENNYR